MRIGLIRRKHSPGHEDPIMVAMIRFLNEWGVEVDEIEPRTRLVNLDRLRVKHDLYLFKSGDELALTLAGVLHALGGHVFNPYPVLATLWDKVIATQRLRALGVPVPRTYVVNRALRLGPLLRHGPIILKPARGPYWRGFQVIRTTADLDEASDRRAPVLAQYFKEPDGGHLTLYAIGDQLFGVKRVWPARTLREKLGQVFPVTPSLHDIALRCGRAFGTKLYGVDMVINRGQPYVVDISGFPGFKGVPDAGLRLADHIYTVGQRIIEQRTIRTAD